MRAPTFGATAKARKGRAFDGDRSRLIRAGQYALLRVAKGGAGHQQIAPFKANARAIAVAHGDVLKDNAINNRIHAVENQRRFAGARATVKNRCGGRRGAQCHLLPAEDRAILVNAGCDDDGAFALADRIECIVKAVERLAKFRDRKRTIGLSNGWSSGEQHQ